MTSGSAAGDRRTGNRHARCHDGISSRHDGVTGVIIGGAVNPRVRCRGRRTYLGRTAVVSKV